LADIRYTGISCPQAHRRSANASVQDWSTGMFAANTLGLVGAGSLHLAFLSPATWRRWIVERTAT